MAEIRSLLSRAAQKLERNPEEAAAIARRLSEVHWIECERQLQALTDAEWAQLALPLALQVTLRQLIASGPTAAPVDEAVTLKDDSSTVTFNVRGTRFQVFRHLLASHPDTIPAQLLDDIGTDPSQLLFLDADPTRFRLLLDWYRDGPPVHVPVALSVEEVRREFEVLGISLDDTEIMQSLPTAAIPKAIQAYVSDINVRASRREAELNEVRLEFCALRIAQAVLAVVNQLAAADALSFPVRFKRPTAENKDGKFYMELHSVMSQPGVYAAFLGGSSRPVLLEGVHNMVPKDMASFPWNTVASHDVCSAILSSASYVFDDGSLSSQVWVLKRI